jgi:hypothetical protein
MLDKTRDRNWGGTWQSVACEPYISGYSFVKWQLPEALERFHIKYDTLYDDIYQKNGENDQTESFIQSQVLDCACTSVTPPGGTLNKVSFATLGGGKWAVPGSIDYGNTITLKYTEFSGLPIFRIHRTWCRMIRDNKIGLTGLAGDNGKDMSTTKKKYNKSDYSATLLYWTTKPDGVTVEYYAAYSGVFPLKDPMDLFNGDINSVDKLEIDIDYNVDMIWHEDWVYNLAKEEAKKPKYGAKDHTLWSRDGFRYSGQSPVSFKDTSSKL